MVSFWRIPLLVLLLLTLAASAWAKPSIPPLTGRVVDLAHVLDQPTVDALTKQLAEHEAATTDQIVVVTLPDLQGETIEQWGYALLNGWGIGQRGKNNGVVLVVAPNDRRLRIEVGYGLEYALTGQAAAGIIESEIVPRFKSGDLPGGVTAGVNAILATIAGTYRPPLIEATGSLGIGTVSRFEKYLPMVGFPLLFVFIVAINRLFGRRSRALRRQYYDTPGWTARDRDGWGSRSSGLSGGRSSGGFSGGGGRGGGGGASGRW
jgi:uncharacterized protein